ncbi:ATP-grasp domain-containing protein [Arenibacter amylolyticus]|uniref:ATP-grasp domain-containing protein n=1 Tax=Arenibacter amylolyticus TaxID=1406873 RepID=UPI000A3B243D|nr:hypothetical protein [Arenibacter amylolyticus]
MKIAILTDETKKQHSTNWSFPWIEYCKLNNIDFELVNPYNIGQVKYLLKFDIILWHFNNYSHTDMLMARNVLFTLEAAGKKVFPSIKDAWHFDDKLAETYLLESINAPIPMSFYYYRLDDLQKAINNNDLNFPIIAKLRNGSGSHNVKLLNNSHELIGYSKKMFNSGIDGSPNIFYKTSSNLKSSKNFKTIVNRAKRIPEFIRTYSSARKFNREKGYVFLQEFIPNDGFDLKIVVVGDKLSFIGRNIRKGEFRASGGGSLFYDKNMVPKNVINSAFKISDKLGFNCMGYDYVVDKSSSNGKVIEISYGFSHQALLDANGYFDREGNWHDEPLNAPKEILQNLILKNRMSSK